MTAYPQLILWLIAGILTGAVYLRLVARTVRAIVESGPNSSAALYLLARVALAAVAFGAAALQGALPVLAMLLGFLIARTFAIRRAREAGDGQ